MKICKFILKNHCLTREIGAFRGEMCQIMHEHIIPVVQFAQVKLVDNKNAYSASTGVMEMLNDASSHSKQESNSLY